MEITTYKQAARFLKGKGTKVAVQPLADADYIFAEKIDFLNIISKRSKINESNGPTNYDGDPQWFWTEDKVLHVPAGSL